LLKVIADAKPADAELVRSYGADIVVERGPGFAEAIRRELSNGVDALLDAAALGKSPLAPSVMGASTFRFAAGETSPPNGESRSSQ